MSGPAAVTVAAVCVAGKLMVSRKQPDNDSVFPSGFGKNVCNCRARCTLSAVSVGSLVSRVMGNSIKQQGVTCAESNSDFVCKGPVLDK